MRALIKLLALIFFFGFIYSCEEDELDPTGCVLEIEELQMNQLQVLGSHNSYRKKTPPIIEYLVDQSLDLLPPGFDPGTWDYTHYSLANQLTTYKMRSIELDVFRDPDGGRFYMRRGYAMVGLPMESNEPKLLDPGLKILHFPDFDYETHYLTFKDALNALKQWSERYSNHLPITVMVEAKGDSPADMLPGFGLTEALQFNKEGLEEIETEINDVFGTSSTQIFRPDDLKGSYSTLNEAALAGNWPALKNVRGKIIFILFGYDGIITDYADGHPSLTGRNMFVFTDVEEDQVPDIVAETAFLKVDDPIANLTDIKDWVSQGYMVRTRADADTYEARTGDTERMDVSFESGAQIISTDYYKPDARASFSGDWTGYYVQFPNFKLALINSINGPIETLTCDIRE